MITSWRSIVEKLAEGEANLSSSCSEIAMSAEQMCRGAESQAEQILIASAGMEEMSASIREVANHAKTTSDSAMASAHNANEGAGKIKEAIEGILYSRHSIE